MKLVIHELTTTLTQSFNSLADSDGAAVRPHLFISNSPAGNLKMQKLNADGRLIDESPTIDISTITSAIAYHGYVKFDLVTPYLDEEAFQLALVPGGGYTFSESAFVGWCTDFDLRKYTPTFTPASARSAPFDVEFWKKGSFGMVRELDFDDSFESSAEPTFANPEVDLPDNSGPFDITGLVFDKADFEGADVFYRLRRANDSTEKTQKGWLNVNYSIDGDTWELTDEPTEFQGGASGVTFSITSAGQVQATTDTLGGAGYESSLNFFVVVKFNKAT